MNFLPFGNLDIEQNVVAQAITTVIVILAGLLFPQIAGSLFFFSVFFTLVNSANYSNRMAEQGMVFNLGAFFIALVVSIVVTALTGVTLAMIIVNFV